MSYAKLHLLGAFVGAATFVPTSFEWTPEGAEEPVKFDISVKSEVSAADFEMIQFGGMGNEDSSIMARRVHRLVRLVAVAGEKVEEGEGQFSIEQALQLQPSLLLGFVTAINKVVAESGKPKAKPAKKAKLTA